MEYWNVGDVGILSYLNKAKIPLLLPIIPLFHLSNIPFQPLVYK
jgi:hypothetical protein